MGDCDSPLRLFIQARGLPARLRFMRVYNCCLTLSFPYGEANCDFELFNVMLIIMGDPCGRHRSPTSLVHSSLGPPTSLTLGTCVELLLTLSSPYREAVREFDLFNLLWITFRGLCGRLESPTSLVHSSSGSLIWHTFKTCSALLLNLSSPHEGSPW